MREDFDRPSTPTAGWTGRSQDMFVVGAFNVCPAEVEQLLADPDELVAHCRERLADFKAPRGVVVLATLPHNATGQVDRAALRAIRLR